MEARNGKIKSTFLGIEDHGMLTYFLNIEGESWGQGFGGHACGGKTFLPESIRMLLEALEVDSWEELKGKYVRVEGGTDKLHRIGHITKNQWYDITEHSKKCRE